MGRFLRESTAIAQVELTKLVRDPTEMFSRAVQPVLWLAVFGQVLAHARGIDTGGIGYLAFITPGILAQSVLFSAIFYGIAVIWERDLGVVHKLLDMRGDRRFTLLRGVEPLHCVDVAARRREQHAPDARRLGARRSLLVHADRALVGGEAELRRRAQGVPHHSHRRHRAADRRDHDVLRRAERDRARHVQHPRRERVGGEPEGQPHTGVVVRARITARDHR